MENIIAGTSHPTAEGSASVKPIAEIEGVIGDLARRDFGPSNSKDTCGTAANVDSLVQRATSLSELQTMIREFKQLHQFLGSEGERLEREISEYAQLSKSTLSSARPIAENILRWKKRARTSP